MGILNMGKVRREGVPSKVKWVGCSDGTIYEVPDPVYEELKDFPNYYIDRATLDYKCEACGIQKYQGVAETRNQINNSGLNSLTGSPADVSF